METGFLQIKDSALMFSVSSRGGNTVSIIRESFVIGRSVPSITLHYAWEVLLVPGTFRKVSQADVQSIRIVC